MQGKNRLLGKRGNHVAGRLVSVSYSVLIIFLCLSPPAYSEDELSDVFVSIADRIKPSIVKLNVVAGGEEFSRTEKELAYWIGEDRVRVWKIWWRGLFKEPLPDLPRPTYKTGTAIVVREDGLLLTNEHLAHSAESITATVHDGRRFNVKVIATDEWMDLCLLKIPAGELTVPRFGDSSLAKVGQRVLVFGNALGYPHTVSQGIISGVERYVHDEFGRIFENVIQTDAAMNFGDSGGALVSTEGEVIGINLAVVPQGQNVSFALPTNEFLPILKSLIRLGKIERGWIGLEVAERKEDTSKQILVRGHHGNSPSSGAGFQRGDVIMDVDGRPPGSAYEFYRFIREQPIGGTLSIRIQRDTDTLTKHVMVASFPSLESHLRYTRTTHPYMQLLDETAPGTRWMVLLAFALCVWLALRMWQSLTERLAPVHERRYGGRRKGERRKGERRKTIAPSFMFIIKSSRADRRSASRRIVTRRLPGDRRQERTGSRG